MRIFDLQTSTKTDVHTLSATVAWEDNDRQNVEVFFRIYADKGYVNSSDYHAFLVACVVPALYYRERRIRIEGAVCPWLVENLKTMMAYMNHWYWYEHQRPPEEEVVIEAMTYVSHDSLPQRRVGMFFSGGVDSIYTLRKNHMTLPTGHAGRIQDLIFLHGFDSYGNRPKQGTEEDAFWYFVKECQPIAADANVNIIPVWTNLRNVGMEDTGFFVRECFGSTLGAVAYALSGKLTDVVIASSDHIADIRPWGSTSLTDPRLSSFHVHFHHDAEKVKRIEKVQAIADWQVGLDHLRVCFSGGPGTLNCGECEKCLRTKLALLCTDKLKTTKVFQNNDLNVGLLLKAFNATEASIPYSKELIQGLRQAGYQTLARVVGFKRLQYYLKKALNLREIVTKIDKNIFRGWLKHSYHASTNRSRQVS